MYLRSYSSNTSLNFSRPASAKCSKFSTSSVPHSVSGPILPQDFLRRFRIRPSNHAPRPGNRRVRSWTTNIGKIRLIDLRSIPSIRWPRFRSPASQLIALAIWRTPFGPSESSPVTNFRSSSALISSTDPRLNVVCFKSEAFTSIIARVSPKCIRPSISPD